MNRDAMLGRIQDPSSIWDLIIIGGGATGLGTAIESASRGYRTLLLEQSDFAKGTSSRSTKLVHGGVRYLKQGNLSLVLEALKERGLMRQNAPHLVHNLPFIVPNYDWWEAPFYGIGLRVYDMLAGKHGFGPSRNLTKEETLQRLPTIETQGLRGGVVYYDGQFDDARLAINMAETAAELGGTLINYMKVTALTKVGDILRGVAVLDQETGATYELSARAVINATGAYVDSIRSMDDKDSRAMIRPSQGVHIVLKRDFLPGDSAIMVPHTDDGRVLFAIPWHDRVVVGTTDTPIDHIPLEPRPLEEELEFLLSHAARYLSKDPGPGDVLSAFAGIRPLVSGDEEDTAQLSRDHTLFISRSGLVTITGGKWTTYRKMAEDTVDHAATLAQLEEKPSVTRDLAIHGYHRNAEQFGELAVYGSDAPLIDDLTRENPRFAERLHPDLPARAGEVIWAVRQEMARSVEDVLARRTRCLLLDAKASMEMAPKVAGLMAQELGRDLAWQQQQTDSYRELAKGYLISESSN
jgi:glycerol-3-phosphate dehydrogenase